MDAFIKSSQEYVSGNVSVKLYKGNIMPYSLQSPFSLYNSELAGFTMDEKYDQKDAKGFINIYGLPEKIQGVRKKNN